MVLKMKIKFLSFFSLFLCLSNIVFSKSLLNEDLKNSLEFLYSFNPELKYERNILRAKDELMPQALSEFRPEIKGYYQKGKVQIYASLKRIYRCSSDFNRCSYWYDVFKK